MSIIPPPLKKGDTIGVMSPSSYITQDDLDKSIEIIKGHGYKTYIHPQTLNKHHQSAGGNKEKCAAFHDLIKNPEIHAIIFSCGGNRALHWSDMIDFSLVKANPKIIMGFSDCTVPLNLIHAKTGLMTFYGPTLRWFMTHQNNQADILQCFRTLSAPHHLLNSDASPMIGGNLSLIQYLLNDLDFTGKTLFIEDWNIELSHLDRTFCHLRRQGVFDKINGLILGQFDNLLDTGRPYGFIFDDIISEHVPASLPIDRDVPFGHGDRLITLPIG